MAPAVTDLYQVASDFLAACETAVANSPGGPIARSYVSPGLPSADCPPEIAVWVGGPIEGTTLPLAPPLVIGRRGEDDDRYNIVRLTCYVSRCVPTLKADGSFPTPAEIEVASKLTIGDVWAIWNVVPALYRARMVFARDDGERRELFWDPAIPIDPRGGAGGWMVPIRVELDGYRPTV